MSGVGGRVALGVRVGLLMDVDELKVQRVGKHSFGGGSPPHPPGKGLRGPCNPRQRGASLGDARAAGGTAQP